MQTCGVSQLVRAFGLMAAMAMTVRAQTPQTATQVPAAAAPQLSPKAAYDNAMHPFDMTRRSINNWSAAEVAALRVSIDRAKSACEARDPHSFGGADLIDLARLCGLGQEWGTVVLATTLYIDAPATPKPLLTEAHAARVDADLRLHSEPDALRDTKTMLTVVPYSPLVAEATDEAIDYMRFSSPQDALALAAQRQPFVIAEFKKLRNATQTQPVPASPAPVGSANSATAAQDPAQAQAAAGSRFSVHDLYAQGMTLPSLQQLANQSALAQQTLAQLDSALPVSLSPDEGLPIAESRQRYALLGKPLPGLTLESSLSMPTNILPTIPATNTMTVLLLFPDWCAQCVTAMSNVPETVFSVAGHDAYYYGLLAETVPERKPDHSLATQPLATYFSPAYAASLLAEKPVVTVPPSTLRQFAATDFPFLVLTDSTGIVRVAQPVDADDLISGGRVDSAVALVGQRWPGPAPRPASPASTASPSGTR